MRGRSHRFVNDADQTIRVYGINGSFVILKELSDILFPLH